ncbi:meiosis-specific protein MEI4 [Suncus etruscus]|uniref:meiosis-specific protein MEI4 n=1 Tax=Suncus etruscus TaxID=109475 RepID=UPI0021109203|nr:meiosis-specific protein MEI4 [Suncus etruscus]
MDDRAWYLRTSKLALALAIIHSKPANKSSKEYTEDLARMGSGLEVMWRSKIEALETEVLQLRQKLLQNGIYSLSTKKGDSTSQLQAQNPSSSENTLTLLEDSGCYLSNEPSEMSQHFVESCSPLTLLPLPNMKGGHSAAPENLLFSHMQFLQHLIELKSLTEPGGLNTDLRHFENNSSTVSDSALQLLNGLIKFYYKPKFPFSSFWTEAVDTIAKLIDDSNLSKHILKTCSKKLEEFERTLLHVILNNSHINRFQMQHYISQNLVTLGSCSVLRKSVISLLLSEVNSFTDKLGTISQVQTSYDVTHYENIFSILWVLEQLLQKDPEGNTSHKEQDDQEIKKFLHKHDLTIFQLSDAFPLFTFYLWRLGILLRSEKTQT